MPSRYPATGASGGRGADVWVILNPNQAAWLARNIGGSLTVMSKADETVRISNFVPAPEGPTLFDEGASS